MSHAASSPGPSRVTALPRASAVQGAAPGRPFASLEVHADASAVLDDWRDLARVAPCSPYQSPDWLLPWIDTVGAAAGIAPLIVVARDAGGRASALLPLGARRRGGCTVGAFLGGKDSNFNMGLFRPGPVWTRAALRDLLRRAGDAGTPVDLWALRNQPHDWEGVPNPLAALPHQASPSFAHRATLLPDPEAFLRGRLSRDTRKKLRQKTNRLRAFGPVSVVEAGTSAAAAELIDALMVQRAERDEALGLPGDERAGLRDFLRRTVGRDGPVRLYGLRCGDRIVATLGGAHRGRRFCGMLTSFSPEAEMARTSPGELLLCEVMKRHCAAGDLVFDLGVGEARYKESYCPDVEPLFDAFLPLTMRGRLLARFEAARMRLKRAVKQSPWAWRLAQRFRRLRPRRAPLPRPRPQA